MWKRRYWFSHLTGSTGFNRINRKIPIKYNLFRNAASLSPKNIVKNEENYFVRFGLLAEKLHVANKVKASISDSTNLQFLYKIYKIQ